MKKILAILFLVFGFLEIIILSIISTFDNVEYHRNHFIAFMSHYGLWAFFIGAWIMVCLGILFLVLNDRKK